MALPKAPKKETRSISLTTRLPPTTVEHLKALAKAHNLSQASVLDILIEDEYKRYSTTKGKEGKKNAENGEE